MECASRSIREAARLLGGESHRDRVRCPGPGHSRIDRSLEVWFRADAPGGFLVNSFAGDDPLVCRDYVRKRLRLPDWRSTERLARPARELDPDPRLNGRIAAARVIWRRAVHVRGTLGETYFRSRGLEIDSDLTHVMRFHGSLNFDGHSLAGIVALMRDAVTNEPCGIHRTYLDSAGRKIDRRMLGRAKGAAIKLDPDARVTVALHIGEGIETCLAGRQLGYRPTWALGSAGAVAAFPVLDGVEQITVFAENDEASHRATRACGERYANAGREAWVCEPPSGDLNDIVRRAV